MKERLYVRDVPQKNRNESRFIIKESSSVFGQKSFFKNNNKNKNYS